MCLSSANERVNVSSDAVCSVAASLLPTRLMLRIDSHCVSSAKAVCRGSWHTLPHREPGLFPFGNLYSKPRAYALFFWLLYLILMPKCECSPLPRITLNSFITFVEKYRIALLQYVSKLVSNQIFILENLKEIWSKNCITVIDSVFREENVFLKTLFSFKKPS